MANLFKIKRNDTKPTISATLQDSTGSAINLTLGSYVFFNLATNDNTFTPVFSGLGTISDATGGKVEYTWSSSDSNRSGTYLGEFEVTFNDSSVLTLPTDHSLRVVIPEDYDS